MATPRKLSYDSECEKLARHFLTDKPDATDADAADLAQDIQDAIEDWFFANERGIK